MNVGKRRQGFTLVELIVVIALIAILATVAIPNFHNLLVRSRLTADFNQVLNAMHYARSEAAKRRGDVTLLLTAASEGWVIRVWNGGGDDGDETGPCPAGPDCFREINESSSPVSVSMTPASGKVTFNALGRAPVSCPVGTPCSISLELSGAQGGAEVMEINSLGNIYRPDV